MKNSSDNFFCLERLIEDMEKTSMPARLTCNELIFYYIIIHSFYHGNAV